MPAAGRKITPPKTDSTTIRGDGVRLACQTSGPRDAPTVVFVHGYPDNHRVWDRVIGVLSERYHCVSYDVRGAGASSRPRRTPAYRLYHLARDLAAVIDWASPRAPVHIVGHDWGSIQSWELVTDPAYRQRIASFTSISGPCLDHIGFWLRAQRRANRAGLSRQARKSWYIAALHLPLLPGLAWHTLLGRFWPFMADRYEGEPLPVNPTLSADGAYGAKLYRANVIARLLRPRERATQIPVQLILPESDPFVGPAMAADIDRWVDNLQKTPIEAAHWVVQTHPDTIADHCSVFIEQQACAPARTTAPARRAHH